MPRKKQLSDEAVLHAAMGVFFLKGPRDFTLAEIADAAGISAATILQRFGSKYGLVEATLALSNRMAFAALADLPKERGAKAVIRLFVERTPGPDHEGRLSDQLLWLRESMADPRINALTQDYFKIFRKAIRDRMPPLKIPADDAVRLVEAVWHGSMTQWGIDQKGHLRAAVERNLKHWFDSVIKR